MQILSELNQFAFFMTSIQKLDKCLSHLANTILVNVTANIVSKELDFENGETIEMLDKLVEDKHATKHKGEYMYSYWYSYKITFMGRLFISQGGYSGKQIDTINNRSYLLGKKRTLQILNAAVIVGGIYYLLEIVRIYIVPLIQHFCDCVFVWQKTS